MFVLGVANGAVEISLHRAAPTRGNAAWRARRQPLPWRVMLIAILISNDRRRRRSTRSGWRENWFALGANRNETIHVFRIRQDRIDGRGRKILLLGGKLIEKTLVAWVNGTQEEHDLENLWNRNL